MASNRCSIAMGGAVLPLKVIVCTSRVLGSKTCRSKMFELFVLSLASNNVPSSAALLWKEVSTQSVYG